MRVKYHHAATATITITTIAPMILPVADLCRVTSPPKPGTIWVGYARASMVPSNEGAHADQPLVQQERENRPRRHARHHSERVARERARRVHGAGGAITPARPGEIRDGPHEESAEQHHVM